ncbi:hypothetical protein HanPSC8_Chr16g0710411 [Helianthus annuus]|nr:hypothetical protein HanPSC8_Chr16g0710411 [Helianthus annuus]
MMMIRCRARANPNFNPNFTFVCLIESFINDQSLSIPVSCFSRAFRLLFASKFGGVASSSDREATDGVC